MMVWLDGEWKEEGEAVIGISDRGFLRGEGVFETMLAVGGKVFALAGHWQRLERGATVFGLTVPPLEEVRGICAELLLRNDLTLRDNREHRIRLRVTRTPHHLLMTASRSAVFLKATHAASSPYPRNERGALVGIKAISYGENVIAATSDPLKLESLLENTKGEWCEGTWSNLFAVESGTILTPPLNSGCLPGVTREVVMKLAREKGYPVKEVAKPMEWLSNAEEIFLTSSLQGVVGVIQYNGREISYGEITKELSEALLAHELEAL